MTDPTLDTAEEPKLVHIDGYCPFLTCSKTESHDHHVCETCGAVRYGNLFCERCRAMRDVFEDDT